MSTTTLSFRADDPALHTVIGERAASSIQLRSGIGCGLFGPYVDLPSGRCLARIKFAGPSEGHVVMDMTAEFGKIVLASRGVDLNSLEDHIVELTAVLPRPLLACEVRLHCTREGRYRRKLFGAESRDDARADISAVEIEFDRHENNPYATRPAFAFWRRAVAGVPPFALDPMIAAPFAISREHKIATAGSCFAQNIANNLAGRGLHYFVPERAPDGMPATEAIARNFGTFSARYGNIYTARQLLQLFERAHGRFAPALSVWRGKGDYLIDPFRPQIQPMGYSSEHELLSDRERHLEYVRQMFRELDIFVFTLGLTEAWINRADGSVIPTAPGVAGGMWDPAAYEFKNFTVVEVVNDLTEFMRAFRSVNPHAKIIFTVSPVPLIATYDSKHVLVSTVYSKSVLRVAAEEITRAWEGTSYFPSYEIVTWSGGGRGYFEDDLRSVSSAGVQHVMRVFFKHYIGPTLTDVQQDRGLSFRRETLALGRVVCDEEALDP